MNEYLNVDREELLIISSTSKEILNLVVIRYNI